VVAVRRKNSTESMLDALGVMIRIVAPRAADAGAFVIVGRVRNRYGGL
jgi:hypothetical protein